MAGNFELQILLGSGTFGEAWLARNKTDDSKCVVKVVKIMQLSEKELDQALTEVSVLARCNHKNIIKYMDAFVEGGSLKIAMEYADGGDLHKKIVNQKGIHFGKEVILDWLVQISFALKYIHSQNILHRDLKAQNIFLTSKNLVKIGDFGIARVLRDRHDVAMTTIGTPFYLSPEICQKKPYNHKSDMWALGCVLYEMCTLHVPFNAKDFDSLVMKIMTGQFDPVPSHFGTTIRYLCTRLLDKDPDKRLSANEVLNFSPLKTFVQRYDSAPKRQIPQLALRRYSANVDNKSMRRKSSANDKTEISDHSKITRKDSAIKKVPFQSARKGSDPLRSIQPNMEKKDDIVNKVEVPSPKKKGVDWLSDKENIDPRRLIGNQTYQVKNPKFRRFSVATPRIKRIVSQQRSSISGPEQNQCKQYKDECVRSVLYRNIERQSKRSSAASVESENNREDTTTNESVDDEVFSDASVVLASLEESLQTVIDKSQAPTKEQSKRGSVDNGVSSVENQNKNYGENRKRSSVDYSLKPPVDNIRRLSADKSRRASIESSKSRRTSIESSKNRRASIENSKSRRASIESSKSRRASIESSKSRRASIESSKSRRASIESSKSRRASIESLDSHGINDKKPSEKRRLSSDIGKRQSAELRQGSKESSRIAPKQNGRRISIERGSRQSPDGKSYSRPSSVEARKDNISSIENKYQRSLDDGRRRSKVKLSRKPTVEKCRKVSVSDGCLYVPNTEVDEKSYTRRSSSCDDAMNEREKSHDQGQGHIVRKAGSETYLVKKEHKKSADKQQESSGEKEMIKYINRALYMSLQDFLEAPNTAKNKTFKRLTEIFGEEKLDDIIEVTRECLYNHDNYDDFFVLLSETDVLCLPLIFQYLQLEGSQ